MTYRAPVADIAFALKHAAGFGPALADGLYGDLTEDVVDAVLEEAGRFATEVLAPAQSGRRPAWASCSRTATVTTPPGWKEAYRAWAGGRLERARRAGRLGRPGPAAGAQRRLHRDVELGLPWPSASARC